MSYVHSLFRYGSCFPNTHPPNYGRQRHHWFVDIAILKWIKMIQHNSCKMYLFMTASSSTNRNTRGLAFPTCGSGVIEPTSTKPNPIFSIPSTHSPCLSNPAASPIGDSKSFPNTFVFY